MWMSCRKWMCYLKQSHRAPGAFEPVATAVIVLLAWAAVASLAGAWRTVRRDA